MANYIDNTSLSQILTYLKKYIDDIANTKQNSLNRTIWGASDTGGNISGNMFVGDNTKVNNYLEYANGAINLQGNIFITGGNAATKDYVTTAVNAIQIGGRNLARNSKGDFTYNMTDVSNFTGFMGKAYWVGNKNQNIVISGDVEYSNVVLTGTGSACFAIQGNQDINGWNIGNPFVDLTDKIHSGNGSFHFSSRQHQDSIINNNFWNFGFRSDYITGTVTFRNLKVEYGTKETSWSPAPEDVDASISSAITTSESDAASKYLKLTGGTITGNMFVGDSKKVNNYLEYANGAINLQGNIFITGGNAATKDYVNDKVNWKIVTVATDLNTMTTTGKYLMEGTLTNTPTSAWAYLIVENATIGRITQTIWHDTDATNQYTRQLYNTVWGGWVKIANSGDIPTKLSQLTNDIHANIDGVSYGTLKIYPSAQISDSTYDDGAITPKGVNKYVSANYLKLTGGTMNGTIDLSPLVNSTAAVKFRSDDSSGWASGISYDTSSDECLMIWAANTRTHLKWNAGINFSTFAANDLLKLSSDFEISKSSGTAIGYIGGNTILHSGNYLDYAVARTSAQRPGVTRLYRRDDDTNYSVQTNWTGNYWYLQGYNGDTYHAGVQVDRALSAASADNSNTSTWLSNNSTLQYGASGLQYFYAAGLNTSNSPSANSAPDSNWWHIIRMNHANGGGYYADLAFALNNSQDAPYFRIVVNGSVARGWSKFITSDNIGSQSVSAATKLTGPAHTNGTDGWFRSDGVCGWYNETFAGGIYMNDSNWIRTYNGKNFYCDNQLRGHTISTETNITLDNHTTGNYGIYATMADNDGWYIQGEAASSNNSGLRIGTYDDSNEYIAVSQGGSNTSYTRTAYLLDSNGNTSFPGSLTVAGSLNVSGNMDVKGQLSCNDDFSVDGYTSLGGVSISSGLDLSGGAAGGVGLKVGIYGGGSPSSPTLISKMDNVVLLMSPGAYILPLMGYSDADDGHMIMIKRMYLGGNTANVMANSYVAIVYDSGIVSTQLPINNMMESMTLIYCRKVKMNGYTGIWVQWKNPRDW